MGLFAEIRAACARVAAEARFVRLVESRLDVVARSLVAEVGEPVALDPAHHHLSSPEATLAYVVTLDAVNFGSGWFPELKKRSSFSGYFTLSTALKEHFEAAGPPSAVDLQALTPAACAAIFQQALEPPVDELMTHFAEALRDLGTLLADQHGGSFAKLVASGEGRAERLVEVLTEMPLYRDVHQYVGRDGAAFEVPLYKRAQITCADLAAAFEGRGPGRFEDFSALTLFADNLVPHVLRMEGVLEYVPDLLARIERGERIPSGSPEEVEIRAVALHAVELMVGRLGAQGVETTAGRLDGALWNRGQSPRMKARPRHRTRCVYY